MLRNESEYSSRTAQGSAMFNFKSGSSLKFCTDGNARCGDGQSVYQAAEKKWGKNIMVLTPLNASHFAPLLEDVERYGDPIGTVTVRANESFYVYRLTI